MTIRFRMKRGMGRHYLRKKGGLVPVLPGDVIACEPEQIKFAIDKFEQLDPTPPSPEPKVGLKLVHKGYGYYNVMNEVTGNKINDKPIKKDEALEMVSEYEKEAEKETVSHGTKETEPEVKD